MRSSICFRRRRSKGRTQRRGRQVLRRVMALSRDFEAQNAQNGHLLTCWGPVHKRCNIFDNADTSTLPRARSCCGFSTCVRRKHFKTVVDMVLIPVLSMRATQRGRLLLRTPACMDACTHRLMSMRRLPTALHSTTCGYGSARPPLAAPRPFNL